MRLSLRDVGELDAVAGKPISAFYKLRLPRHSESKRAEYEIGYRAMAETIRKIEHNVRCFDSGADSTADRYTVVFMDRSNGGNLYDCLGMSADPFWPTGFCQHSTAELGPHLGERIPFAKLPEDCRKAVINDFK